MIIRVFRARVHPGKEKEFERFFVDTALPYVRAQAGLVSAQVGLPVPASPQEFCMHMVWRDLKSVQAFAGDDWQTAVVHPDESHLLAETFVSHYQLVGET
ncbi:MAG: antibiotic biosynthesis monooxygenase family protein [Planctomycetota bacterium]|jgi:heme-degrading monooxygenase HmoA